MNRRCSYAEAALYLAIPLGTLRSMVSRRQVPHVRLSARIVVFDLDQLDRWIEGKTVKARLHAAVVL